MFLFFFFFFWLWLGNQSRKKILNSNLKNPACVTSFSRGGVVKCIQTLKKILLFLVLHLTVRWGEQQIPQVNIGLHLSSCRVALRPAVLSAARIWPSVSWYLEISFGFRGLPTRLLLPSGGGYRPAPEAPLNGGSLKIVHNYTYLGSSIPS